MPRSIFTALILLTLTSVIWGIAAPVIKLTLESTPPFTFIFLRLVIATCITLPFLARELIETPLHHRDLPRFLLITLCGQTLYLTFVFLGIDKTSALEGAILSSVTPLFCVLGGVLLFKESISRYEKWGMLIIALGTFITLIPSLMGTGNGGGNLGGNILLIFAGLSWALFALLSKPLFSRYSAFTVTAITFFLGTLSFFPLALWEMVGRGPTLSSSITAGLPGILFCGVFSSVIAFWFYEEGEKRLDNAGIASLFSYLIPLFAAPASFLLLGERLTLAQLLGGLIITLGVLIPLKDYTPKKKHHRRGKL